MTLTRARANGWIDSVDTVSATELATIDTNPTIALDGVDGGTYAPSAAIVIGGASMGMAGPLLLAKRALTRVLPMTGGQTDENGGRVWEWRNGYWDQRLDDTGAIEFSLDVPNRSIITQISMEIDPAGGHGASPTMPSISLIESDAALNPITSLIQLDVYGSAPAYEAPHAVTLAVSPGLLVDRERYQYRILVKGESAPNFQIGVTLAAITVSIDVTEYTEW